MKGELKLIDNSTDNILCNEYRYALPKIKSENIYLFAFDIFLFFGIIDTSMYSSFLSGLPQNLMAIITTLLLAINEFKNGMVKYTRKEVCLLIICIVMFFLCYLRSPIEIAVAYIFMFGARRQKFKKIAIHAYNVTLILLILIIISARIGIIQDIVFEGKWHAVGFRYVLFGPSLLLNLVMLRVYLDKVKTGWINIAFYLALNLWLFKQCGAKLSCGLTTLVVMIVVFAKLLRRFSANRKRLFWICQFCFLLCVLISFGIIYIYYQNTSKMVDLNRVLSGRLELSMRALSDYPISLFGHDIQWVGNAADEYGKVSNETYFYVDNAYIYTLVGFGLIMSLLLWSLYTALIHKSLKNREFILVLLLCVLSVYFLIDNLKLKLVYNTFILLLPMTFMDGGKYRGLVVDKFGDIEWNVII